MSLPVIFTVYHRERLMTKHRGTPGPSSPEAPWVFHVHVEKFGKRNRFSCPWSASKRDRVCRFLFFHAFTLWYIVTQHHHFTCFPHRSHSSCHQGWRKTPFCAFQSQCEGRAWKTHCRKLFPMNCGEKNKHSSWLMSLSASFTPVLMEFCLCVPLQCACFLLLLLCVLSNGGNAFYIANALCSWQRYLSSAWFLVCLSPWSCFVWVGCIFFSSLSCLEVIIKILRIHCNLFHESEQNCCDVEFMWSEIIYL